MKFGVICGRSWIGMALVERLGPSATVYPKEYGVDDPEEWMGLDAMFLIAGRVRPDESEKLRERELIMRMLSDVPYGLRVVYLSSSEVGRNTDYGRHKLHCESLIGASPKGMDDWIIVRPPAIYGPGQPIDSDMLVPSLARTDGTLELREPDTYREYVHVGDLVEHLGELGTYGYSSAGLPSIRATARQMKQLYQTWQSYRVST